MQITRFYRKGWSDPNVKKKQEFFNFIERKYIEFYRKGWSDPIVKKTRIFQFYFLIFINFLLREKCVRGPYGLNHVDAHLKKVN